MPLRQTSTRRRYSKVSRRRRYKRTRTLRKNRRKYGGSILTDTQLAQIKTELRNLGFMEDEIPGILERIIPITSAYLRYGQAGFNRLLRLIGNGGVWRRRIPVRTHAEKRRNLLETFANDNSYYQGLLERSDNTDSDTNSDENI